MVTTREKTRLDLKNIDAIIFDMDGVVTDTASIHAEAWKEMFDEYLRARAWRQDEVFHPFELDRDYRLYVDGKPRFDGVASFLQSRDIQISRGMPEDGIEQDTVYGLGRRKNEVFLRRLREQGVKTYESTIELIKRLRQRDIQTAIISSSRNCQAVIHVAGIEDLFDVRVDGTDLERLGIKGKPEPDMFLEAARRLGTDPKHAVVIEDAIAGVEAGKKGNFVHVIGVDRAGRDRELAEHGADIVVHDLSELEIGNDVPVGEQGITRPASELPSALRRKSEIFTRLYKGTPALFLDYDGTLTPIVEDPAKAVLSDRIRKTLEKLTERYAVTIMSGRDLADVKNMVGISDIVYAGSHGFDIAGPGEAFREYGRGEPFLPVLGRAERELRRALKKIPGAVVERKKFAIAVHYRAVVEEYIGDIERIVDKVAGREPDLKKTGGKKVFELRPNLDWDKGKAMLWLLERLFSDAGVAVPLYIGDDITDEDAFRATGDRGIAILVGLEQRETAAQYVLRGPDEVAVFLDDLASFAEGEVVSVWSLAYTGFNPGQERLRETLCTLGNGFFGSRGAAPESEEDETHYPGTYIAGVFNRLKSEIAGHTIENESMVNAPNWLPLTFRIEGGDWFDAQKMGLLEYRQELDIQRGILNRFIRFDDGNGRRTRVSQRRFVHMEDRHLAGLETTFVAENWTGRLDVRCSIDGRVTNSGVERYRALNGRHLNPVTSTMVNDETIYLEMETTQSHIRIGEGARIRVSRDGNAETVERRLIEESGYIGQEFSLEARQGELLTVEKIAAVLTSRDPAIPEVGLETRKRLRRAGNFDDLIQSHILSWDRLWRLCRIAMEDSERSALVLHVHIFHLLQTVSFNTIDLDAGVPPRGLHGEAYRGHIMWDELFIFPFLNLRIPDVTRALLQYRYRRLPEARWAALQAGYKGAMYPWQSGSDGREESQTLHLNPRSGRWIPDRSDQQRHINIAIAYNIWLYYEVTGDVSFMSFFGAELLVEIARFWASVARYNRSLQRYEICKIIGPDEYHDAYPDAQGPGIDNNAYTNVMVAWVLCRTLNALEVIPEDYREALSEKLSLKREELALWDDITRKIKVPFHDDGIISQFEGYEKLEEFDWEGYRQKYGNIQRLDRILEAEADSTNRYKVSKQADVLMLFYLLSADELREIFQRLNYPFERDTIPKNIEYYLSRTSQGSTLSQIVHSWVLARSQRDLSWHLFKGALESDISDIQGGTTPEGIHLGAMAGTVDLIQRCYTGIETRGGKLWLNPYLPDDLKYLKFQMHYRQHLIGLSISKNKLTVVTGRSNASPIEVGIRDNIIELGPGETHEFDL